MAAIDCTRCGACDACEEIEADRERLEWLEVVVADYTRAYPLLSLRAVRWEAIAKCEAGIAAPKGWEWDSGGWWMHTVTRRAVVMLARGEWAVDDRRFPYAMEAIEAAEAAQEEA